MVRAILISVAVLEITACGGSSPSATRSASAAQALTAAAEGLEFEPVSFRRALFRDVAFQSQQEAGHAGAVLFPLLINGEFRAAKGLDLRLDLLESPDADAPLLLTFDGRGERFSEDRREAFQGLSEREAAELIVRSLFAHWNIEPSRSICVIRTPQAPYAAALIDGELRLNPAFVYMAAAPAAP